MPSKKKSSLGRKTKNASRMAKERSEEDGQMSQERRERVNSSQNISRQIEAPEEREHRYALQRTRQNQKLKTMKLEDRKMKQKSLKAKKVTKSI